MFKHKIHGIIFIFIHISMLWLAACEEGSTGQPLISYPLMGQPLEQAVFTDTYGWEITLTQAQLTFGPLVFCSHYPTFFKRDSLTDCGQVMGEMTSAGTWDLLHTQTNQLGFVSGIEGQVHSLQYDFGWHWPIGNGTPVFLGESGAVSLYLEGEAVHGNNRVLFSFHIDVKPKKSGLFTVAGLAVEGTPTATTTRARVRLSPDVLLRYVDFSQYASMEGVLTAAPGSALENQLRLGLVSGSPLRFDWE